MLIAGNELLHDDAATALFADYFVRSVDAGFVAQVQRYTAAVVAVERLERHGHAHVLGSRPSSIGAAYQFALGNGNTTGLEQRLGQVFITGNLFGDCRGLVCLGSPNAALGVTVAQLHQVAFGEPDVGDAAIGRSVHDV